jgi:hypothetical protein
MAQFLPELSSTLYPTFPHPVILIPTIMKNYNDTVEEYIGITKKQN